MARSTKISLLKSLIKLIFSGQLYIKDGHLAKQAHDIPNGFFGIGVAASNEPRYNDYLINALNELGIIHVRVDLCSATDNTHQIKLLERLIKEDFRVHLHLLQGFEEAKNILIDKEVENAWTSFITSIVDQYGHSVELLEVGSTVNRPRWAGYSIEAFVKAWNVAYNIIKQRGLLIAGPNITDFEPPYTLLFLDALKQSHSLPDIYTNNLFAERHTEPERFDHKVLGLRFANLIKFNLLKKSRLIKNIAEKYSIHEVISPSSFWTLPRIERYTKHAEEKQADYLIRYFVLLAASNAVSKAFWGPLICHREGLIDEGDFNYPILEKITYYGQLKGRIGQFKKRPSFYAYQTVTGYLIGAQYVESYQVDAVHIYRFKQQGNVIDILWTINGLAAKTSDFYSDEAMNQASILDRFNRAIDGAPAFITEQPIFVIWDQLLAPKLARPSHPSCLQINCTDTQQHYIFEDEAWRAVIVASSKAQASLLFAGLHPNVIATPNKLNLLRKGRNAVWLVENPLNDKIKLVAKKPLTLHLHKKIIDYFKPSKAQKSWNSSSQLMRKEVGVSKPVAFFEHKHNKAFDQNIYISEAVEHIGSVRDMFTHFSQGGMDFKGVTKEQAYLQLSNFLLHMHARGVLFRDLSGGNVLIKEAAQGFDFVLIDTNRAHFSNYSLPLNQRVSDLVRICNKLDWDNRSTFMKLYLAALGKNFDLRLRIPFYLYDFKVGFKRTFGRKGIKKIKQFFIKKK